MRGGAENPPHSGKDTHSRSGHPILLITKSKSDSEKSTFEVRVDALIIMSVNWCQEEITGKIVPNREE